MFAYIGTTHPPTAVRQACVGPFTRGAAEAEGTWLNDLLVVKGNRLEVHSITTDGLEPVFDVALFGHIIHMALLPCAVCGI